MIPGGLERLPSIENFRNIFVPVSARELDLVRQEFSALFVLGLSNMGNSGYPPIGVAIETIEGKYENKKNAKEPYALRMYWPGNSEKYIEVDSPDRANPERG